MMAENDSSSGVELLDLDLKGLQGLQDEDDESDSDVDWEDAGGLLATFVENYLPVMDAHGTQFDYDDEFVDVVPLDAERSPGDEIVTMIGQIAAKPAAKAMSIPKAYFTIFKSFIGAGVLYLPNGFSHGGILGSAIGVATIAILAWYCTLLLIQCKEKLEDKSIARKRGVRNVTLPVSYGFIGRVALGRPGRWLVDAQIVAAQVGICCSEIVFISNNFFGVWQQSTDCNPPSWISQRNLALLLIPILSPLVMVRNLKWFGIPNLIADALIVFGLGYIMFYDFSTLIEHGVHDTVTAINFSEFGLFFGTAVFAFEGVCLVLPVHESMSQKKKLPQVMSVSLFIICVLLTAFAGASYLAIGTDVQTIVTLSLPHGSLPVIGVQAGYAVAIIFTFPIMLFPAIKIMEHYLFRHKTKGFRLTMIKNAFRTLVVCFTVAVGIGAAESFENFIALIGGLCMVPLAFVYPAVFHAVIMKDFVTRLKVTLDYFIIAVGLFCMLAVTAIGVRNWMNFVPKPIQWC